MKEIKLTQGKVALVDDDDFNFLSQFKWHALKREKTFYAIRSMPVGNGKYLIIRMHRDILGLLGNIQVDHKDMNGLNNQKNNIRICDHAQNQWNVGAPVTNSSGFKGVSWDKKNLKWFASISFRGKQKNLGRYPDKESAALAYNNAAKQHFGEFARFNQIGV